MIVKINCRKDEEQGGFDEASERLPVRPQRGILHWSGISMSVCVKVILSKPLLFDGRSLKESSCR